MPLSEYEQRVLAQMEQQLSSDDPKLAETFTGSAPAVGPRAASRVLLGVVVAALGLGVIVVGLAQGLSWLGIIGFLVMFGGVLLSMSRGKATEGVPPGGSGGAKPAGPRSQGPSPFMSRLDERWDRRRGER
ncbi:hypothetical protein EDD28_3280 [Salana multivorans]|uniref:DUF3040 family protein n=1 Tax=Salana multivorans TaxID=120377 RepID=A0A3N2D254_9MICO|nr:DUF3040 domain-containing protein [Salana multivorans]MBN8880729.1 DUF3040 domain-containing protein [Salana multivorans]OJX95764.1 MAG: hypothetical protein BGO96_08225 [Micrococcales bacterium 73-15]ROR93852.1 hypothetical protein EDD28_3280 [Salana multivorans]